MATHTKTGDAGTVGHPSIKRVPYLVENTVDFSPSDVQPAANDLVQFLNIPVETCVLAAGLEVLTASTSGVTLDLGWTATSGNLTTALDAWVDGHDSNAATGPAAVRVPYNAVTFKAVDTIDIKVLGAQDVLGKVRVWALMVDVSGVDETDRN